MAGKAAPAMAIAGVLVTAAPQAHAAVKAPVKAAAVTEQARTDALVKPAARPETRTYTVRSGDTLSSIAERYYHNASRWQWIYQANRSKTQPQQYLCGERLTIPYSAPSGTVSYTPRHAKAPATVLTSSASKLSGNPGLLGPRGPVGGGGRLARRGFHGRRDRHGRIGRQAVRLQPHQRLRLLGDQLVNGPAQATFNPMGNAKAAIAISSNGRNWRPWTTDVTGAYHGRC